MIALMGTVALTFVFLGGQIAVMVTDFLQGVFCNFVFLAVMRVPAVDHSLVAHVGHCC